MNEYEITYNAEWIYEDRSKEGLKQTIEAENGYNAAATLQFLIGDKIRVEILVVSLIKRL